MRRDDFCDLVLVRERSTQIFSGGEVACPALMSGERLVGDVTHEVLQEAVLAVLGRARIRLNREHLLAHERRKHGIERVGVKPREREQPFPRERLAEDRAVREQASLLRREAVEPGGDQRMERLGHLELADLADRCVHGAVLHEQAAVEQHAHGLDRVERHTFRAREDLLACLLRQPWNETREKLLHRLARQRLEVERGEVAETGAPGRSPVGELRPRKRDDEDRRVA